MFTLLPTLYTTLGDSRMKKLALAVATLSLFSTSAFAAEALAPIRGKVAEITPQKIVITRNQGKFVREMNIDSGTKVPADIKVGDAVVVQTKFTAMGIAKIATPAPRAAKAKAAAATAPAAKTTR
jgi:hypothetical protein